MNPNPRPLSDEVASSARRRLLVRGGLKAAPLAMTVVGASAFGQVAMSSSTACLAKQPTNPTSAPGTTFVSVPILTFGNGANSGAFVSGANLQAIATAQGTTLNYTGTNGVGLTAGGFVNLSIGNGGNNPFAGVLPGSVLASTDSRIVGAGTPTQSGNVFIRIDASGNVIGFFFPTNTAIGGTGGTALSVSCQSSFASRPR